MSAWKEASSLIIVARAAVTQRFGHQMTKNQIIRSKIVQPTISKSSPESLVSRSAATDYRVLMVRRSGLSSFMASAYVYPGGMVELSDYSPKWWSIFADCGVDREQLDRFTSMITGPRPPMVREPMTFANNDLTFEPSKYLHPDVGLRVTAIRETFEETGILLLTHPGRASDQQLLSDLEKPSLDLSAWRDRVRKEPSAFLELCAECSLCPDLWSLHEWCDWLTPTSVGHRRYDTMFYICSLEKQPRVVLDNSEVTTLKWVTPTEILEEHVQERTFLAPPQVYEMSRIHLLKDFDQIKEFSARRQVEGCERWLPAISTHDDGAISALPGDDHYPLDCDPIGRKPVPDLPGSLDELRANAMNLNRIEIRGSTCTTYCNVKLDCGQLSPITYSAVMPPAIHSAL